MFKMWRSPIFEKKFISGRKCRKYAGKTGFLAFSRDFIISFFWFFAQRCVLIMPKMWPSPIFEKKFFPAENVGNMPEIADFADFHLTFSLHFVVFFTKNINDIAFSFVRSFVHTLVRRARSCFHYQVGPISMWLVSFPFLVFAFLCSFVRSFVRSFLKYVCSILCLFFSWFIRLLRSPFLSSPLASFISSFT